MFSYLSGQGFQREALYNTIDAQWVILVINWSDKLAVKLWRRDFQNIMRWWIFRFIKASEFIITKDSENPTSQCMHRIILVITLINFQITLPWKDSHSTPNPTITARFATQLNPISQWTGPTGNPKSRCPPHLELQSVNNVRKLCEIARSNSVLHCREPDCWRRRLHPRPIHGDRHPLPAPLPAIQTLA